MNVEQIKDLKSIVMNKMRETALKFAGQPLDRMTVLSFERCFEADIKDLLYRGAHPVLAELRWDVRAEGSSIKCDAVPMTAMAWKFLDNEEFHG